MAGGLLSAAEQQEFIDGIRLAMNLGMPAAEENQAVFVTPAEAVPIGYDPSAAPDQGAPTRVQVPYALEYADANGVVLESADIVPSVIVLTLLGPDYDQVRGFQHIELGDERWFYWKTAPEMALDGVPVWQVYLKAEDDA